MHRERASPRRSHACIAATAAATAATAAAAATATHHHWHLDLPSPHSRLPSWQHPDLAVFFDEALAATGDEVRSLC